jgi:hypothetical protein
LTHNGHSAVWTYAAKAVTFEHIGVAMPGQIDNLNVLRAAIIVRFICRHETSLTHAEPSPLLRLLLQAANAIYAIAF